MTLSKSYDIAHLAGLIVRDLLRDNDGMIQVSVEEIQGNIFSYLQRVEAGETVIILDTHIFLWFISGDARLHKDWLDNILDKPSTTFLSKQRMKWRLLLLMARRPMIDRLL